MRLIDYQVCSHSQEIGEPDNLKSLCDQDQEKPKGSKQDVQSGLKFPEGD